MYYNIGDIFYIDSEYAKRAQWCNQNDCLIAEIESDEKGRRFQIQTRKELTQEQICQKRICELQHRLIELNQDIAQDLVGEVVPDFDKRKKEFIALHNELRVLLGKTPREIKQ